MNHFLKYKFIIIFSLPLLPLLCASNQNNFENNHINQTSINYSSKINKKNIVPIIDNIEILNAFDWNSILSSIEAYSKIFENSYDKEILKEKWKTVENKKFSFLNNLEIIRLNKIFIDNSNFLNTNTFNDYKSSIDTNKLTKENSPLPSLTNDFKETNFFIDMISKLYVQTTISSSAYKFNNINSLAHSFNEPSRGSPELIIFNETFEKIYGSKATIKITDFEKPVPDGYFIYEFSETFKNNFDFVNDQMGNIISFKSKTIKDKIPIFAPISLFLNAGILSVGNKLIFEKLDVTLKKVEQSQNLISLVEKELEDDPLNSQFFLNSGNLILITVLPIALISILIATTLLIKKKVSQNTKKEKF